MFFPNIFSCHLVPSEIVRISVCKDCIFGKQKEYCLSCLCFFSGFYLPFLSNIHGNGLVRLMGVGIEHQKTGRKKNAVTVWKMPSCQICYAVDPRVHPIRWWEATEFWVVWQCDQSWMYDWHICLLTLTFCVSSLYCIRSYGRVYEVKGNTHALKVLKKHREM